MLCGFGMAFQKDAFLQPLMELLSPYKDFCDVQLDALWTGQTELDRACLYALQTGGKRFRPALVWMMQEALQFHEWKKFPGPALACEYFHTASLIGDDLPCMDNDDFRRGKPTTHKQFSEAIALLSSYALISEGFRAIAETPLPAKQEASLHTKAISEASFTMGISGLLGGQMLDLSPPGTDPETLMAIIDKKTGALFELCFVLGWIFGGGQQEKLESVRALSHLFGRSFQLLDDIDDYEQDVRAGKKNNFAVLYGLEGAKQKAGEFMTSFKHELRELKIDRSPLSFLADSYLRVL